MKFKKWNIAFLGLVFAVLIVVACTNYFVDPFGYFTFQSGDYDDIDFPVDTSYMQRELKAEHVLHFSDNYDAYLLGGSKAGTYRPAKLQELDGYRYYNMFEIGGSFYEYYLETQFLLEHANPKKIILSISGGEVRVEERDQSDVTYQIPAIMSGESKFLEMFDFISKDIGESLDRLKQRKERESREKYYEMPSTGERNMELYYERVETDWENYTTRYVLEEFDQHMRTLFKAPRRAPYIDEGLEYLRLIKELCDENGVELLVIVSPSFIGELSIFESIYYWEYLVDISMITDYWDFSGYNDIVLNPYNFYNEGHFYYETADLVIDTINGTDSYPGFGVYVTRENVMEHVEQRKADYERLQQEYLETGTIQLQGMEDASCLLKN